MVAKAPGTKKNPAGPRLVDTIRPRDKVTILTPQGQERTGRAVMRGPYGWVLNMGGRHGTPGVATDENIVRVVHMKQKTRENPAPKRDAFTQGYLEAALWSSNDESNDQGGDPLDKNYDIDDIAPETLAQMEKDCEAFQLDEMDDILESGLSFALAGHNFWLTRNHHGTGYWDRELGSIGDRLTEASHAYGSFDLYVGDDGKVHGS